MIVKKYLVNTVEEVQKLILQELGPNAVILTSRHIRYKGLKALFFSNKVEVIAAVDEAEYHQFEQIKMQKLLHRENDEEVLPNRDWESPMETLAENNESSVLKDLSGLEEPKFYEASPIPGTYLDPRFNRKMPVEEAAVIVQKHQKTPIEGFEENLTTDLLEHFAHLTNEKIKMQEEAFDQLVSNSKTYATDDHQLRQIIGKEMLASAPSSELFCTLRNCGISDVIAQQIEKNVSFRLNQTELDLKNPESLEIIKKEVASLIRVSGPICLTKNEPTIICLIGLRGSGKSTAVFQIAHQYEELGKKVTILTQEPRHAGGAEFVMALAKHHDLSTSFFNSKSDLVSMIEQLNDFDLILIDTYGYQPGNTEELLELIDQLPWLKFHWVWECSSKDEDAIEAFQELEPLKIESIIFTKIENTNKKGSLLNLLQITDLPVSYISKNEIATVAEPQQIAQIILQNNQSQIVESAFQSL